MSDKKCVVVIPAYRKLQSIELRFLENGLTKTEGFEQVIAAPLGLTIDESFGSLRALRVERFSKHYFESIKGYNQLMLSFDFYNRFSDFEYLLIHQSDVYLFKDELSYWCSQSYDYIGAPWYRPAKLNKGPLYSWLFRNLWQPLLVKKRKNGWLYNKVGNGGLSLRRIPSALRILNHCSCDLLDAYRHAKSTSYNEDIFWSIEAPKIDPTFTIPTWKKALKFAIEFEPQTAVKELGDTLPFGCHAPMLIDGDFWKKYIPEITITP
ncbi:hypothetical protein FBD94_24535 [Pedobacter hiemivivus]|uniref:DUF5672 domain-containing protein n=1 Tax=Pedobacter hiemivivus TaxID=2530454 RepID=A0A4V5PBL9_9SPHI|nr:DUF5672 family protein [Pedobacter hiemivivus]TKC55816.1 hypothetical protein FBD94_24535 [Pedobacter hiemivivus]